MWDALLTAARTVFCVFPANQSLADFGLFLLQGAPAAKCTLDIKSSLNYPDFWVLRNLVKMACPSVFPFSIYVTYQNISDT